MLIYRHNIKKGKGMINIEQIGQTSTIGNLYWRLPEQEKTRFTLDTLGRNVSAIFRKYKSLFPEFFNKSEEEVAEKFLEQFFLTASDEQINLYLANLSLDDQSDRRIALCIRIPGHPIFNAENRLPYNIAVAVIGYCSTSHPQPIFIPERVFLTHGKSETTTYEKNALANLKQLEENRYPPRDQNNVLHAGFIKNLPKFGVKTKKRLDGWEKFLTFKEKLIKHKTRGLRYLRWEYKEDSGRVDFFVMAENEIEFKKSLSAFKRQNLHAFELDVSQTPYSFNLSQNKHKTVESAFSYLGQIANDSTKVIKGNNTNKELVAATEAFRQLLNKENEQNKKTKTDFDVKQAIFAIVSVELSEEINYRINQLEDDELPENTDNEKASLKRDEKIKQIFKNLPKTGFLSISLLGDLTLIKRHRRAVKNLMQNENCYSPYLSSYLFDIKNANQPDEIPEITEWQNKNLNTNQKSAVQKMLAAPDICLIQGPPGTGKTTVIAEACLQFAKRGEKVLLASQTHDALDNALTRLQNDPNLRAIRLAKYYHRITDDGKEFIGDNLLNKQYVALREYIEREYIEPQQNTQTKINQLTEWLSEAEFVESDLMDLCNKEHKISSTYKKVSENLRLLKVDYDQQLQISRQQKQAEQELKQLIDFLKLGKGNLNGLSLPLPECTYSLAEALCELQTIKIEQYFLYSTFLAEHTNQAAILDSIYYKWSRVDKAIPKMEADLDRLKSAGTIQSADTKTLLQIASLETEIQRLDDQLKEEPENYELFREFRQKEKEHKTLIENIKNNTRLTGDYYNLFSDSDAFINNKNLADVQTLLAERVKNIIKTKERLALLIQQTISQLEQKLSTYTVVIPSDRSIKEKESELFNINNNLKTIREQHIETDKQAKAIQQKMSFSQEESLSETIEIAQQNLSQLNSALEEIKRKTQHFQPLFLRWKAILNDSDKRAENDWGELIEYYRASCNLVAISCNEDEYTLTNAKFDSFDVVIIDEVSKATPLELLLPLMRGKKAILVGDHRQLPPIFNEADGLTFEDEVEQNEANTQNNPTEPQDTDLTKENLIKFEKMVTASLFKELFEQAPESLRERLNIQFRMHPDIMKMINYFYEGQLECGNSDAPRAHGIEFKTKNNCLLRKNDHLLWIDTSNDENGTRFAIEESNNINKVEAKMIAKTLMEINRQTEISGEYSKKNKLKVGVVSFYQPQCRCIRDEIRKLNNGQLKFSSIDVEINTVIKYQGKEKPIILLSLVKNDGKDHKEKIPAGRANIARFEFINVAMSRAQNLLLVFGAKNMLENREVKLPRMDKMGYDRKMVYKNMFHYLEFRTTTGRIWSAREFAESLPILINNKKVR